MIFYFYGTLVLLHYIKTNITLQQNQCPIDTVNIPMIVVENTSCGIMSVSHAQNQARLRTLSNVELGAAPLHHSPREIF